MSEPSHEQQFEEIFPFDAKHLVGRARVKFEKQDGAFIVFNELPDPITLTRSTEISEINASTSDFQLEDSSDGGSIWSANLPEKHSSKLATIVGWVCVSWMVLMHLFHIIAIAFQDGSFLWAILYVISGVFAIEVPYFFLPFLLCICPSSLQVILVFVAWFFVYLIEFILEYALPFWNKDLSFGNLIAIVLVGGVLPFIPRAHLYYKSHHRKGNLLEMGASLLRYYVVITVAEIIKYISDVNSITSNGAPVSVTFVSQNRFSSFFAYISFLLLMLIHTQNQRHPQARSLFDLFGMIKIRDFFPFALICFQMIIFTVAYIAAFSDIDLDTTVSYGIIIVFYVCFVVVAVQVVALSTETRWLSWII